MYLKYMSIPYKHLGSDFSGADCLGLVRLYYKEELGILIPEVDYASAWYNSDPNLIIENYEAFGFVRINTPKQHAVVILELGRMFNHLGIIIQPPHALLHTTKRGTICEVVPSIALPSTYILEYRGTHAN